ncbi:hypothetical protein E4U47_004265 [Claviceps purpurea]|nr:hypothetical protein E4U28_007798 [Claviceps purpurea]KAG6254231.1 hypothetical protein E4U23_006602 [Claviceps purpurea]KAG6269145.1 hypothetical protein E4U47_004265 [Claviceps purpurea]
MGRKKADINSVRELILTLTREGISQEEILEEVNAQLVAQDQRTISLRTLQRYLQEWSLDRTDPESVRELIQTLLQDGCHQDEILEEVNTQLVAQNQRTISLRTLQRNLKEWGLNRAKGAQNLQHYYEDISELFLQNVSVPTIVSIINGYLAEQDLPPIVERTLYSQLDSWGFKRRARVQITEELISRVRYYFFAYGYSDILILHHLQQCDNLPCTLYTIRQIRFQNGMKRRCLTREDRTLALESAMQFFEQDLPDVPAVRNAGQGEFYHYMQQNCEVLVSQNRICELYRSVSRGESHRHLQGKLKHSTDFHVPGPNFLWCLVGLEEFGKFGLRFYACIDAYSRCIIWFYCGRSATAALCAQKLYLRTTKRLGMRPFFTRSDDVVRPELWVAAQATLADANPNTVTYEDSHGQHHTFTQANRISSSHLSGPIAPNFQLKSWWRTIQPSSSADSWIESFDYLAKYALFIEGNLVDQIALYAVYGPLIRDHFAHFVQSWNTRPIHAPRAGGQVVTGTPAEIYLTHTAGNWGVPFGQSGDADDRIALTQMLDPLQSVDTQAFLSLETGDWCNIQLQRMGYLEAEVAECTQQCLNSYLQLRQLIQQHQDSNAQPILRLAPVPPGDSGELIRLLQQNAEVELTGGIGLRGDPITPEYLDQIRQFEAEEMESMIS